MVTAWLEGHMEGGPSRSVTGFAQGNHFGMGLADSEVGAFTHHLARLVHNYGANPRVGMSSVRCGELDCSSHVTGIAHSVARH